MTGRALGIFGRIVPNGVCIAEIEDAGQDVYLRNGESGIVATADARRVRDFTLGRDCAHRALRDLGIATETVMRRDDGAPLWPAGVSGSVTHTEGFAAAAVASAAQMAAIGIDAERVSDLAENVARRIFGPEERSYLEALPLRDQAVASITLFSAKEAYFKARAPAAGTLGFRDILVRLDGDAFLASAAGKKLKGGWAIFGNLVATAICVPMD